MPSKIMMALDYTRANDHPSFSFRFVVKPFGNYLTNIIEPDSNFDWDSIEQVVRRDEQSKG
jgi:hypothetical protein